MKKIFLIDSNSFITPYEDWYPFDIMPGFWDKIKENIQNGSIVILDMVMDEILKGNDALCNWINDLGICPITHRQPEIIVNYGRILQYLQDNPCYKPSAYNEWAKNSVADAWLIATAMVYDCLLVTLEKPNGCLNMKLPSKVAKIPDVAHDFHVETLGLVQMMRSLHITL